MRVHCPVPFIQRELTVIFLIIRDDISKMEYLTMCIKEGMRDHCPVPFIQREFTVMFLINRDDISKMEYLTMCI